ncbi:MAG: hypothetical protein WKG32_00980 [Gemmatimonadaceae bacterium]
MTTPSSGPSGFDNEQSNLGDADAVPKTSYVTGRGTEPEAGARKGEKGETGAARVGPGGGLGVGGLVIGLVVLAIAAFFGFAFFR